MDSYGFKTNTLDCVCLLLCVRTEQLLYHMSVGPVSPSTVSPPATTEGTGASAALVAASLEKDKVLYELMQLLKKKDSEIHSLRQQVDGLKEEVSTLRQLQQPPVVLQLAMSPQQRSNNTTATTGKLVQQGGIRLSPASPTITRAVAASSPAVSVRRAQTPTRGPAGATAATPTRNYMGTPRNIRATTPGGRRRAGGAAVHSPIYSHSVSSLLEESEARSAGIATAVERAKQRLTAHRHSPGREAAKGEEEDEEYIISCGNFRAADSSTTIVPQGQHRSPFPSTVNPSDLSNLTPRRQVELFGAVAQSPTPGPASYSPLYSRLATPTRSSPRPPTH